MSKNSNPRPWWRSALALVFSGAGNLVPIIGSVICLVAFTQYGFVKGLLISIGLVVLYILSGAVLGVIQGAWSAFVSVRRWKAGQ